MHSLLRMLCLRQVLRMAYESTGNTDVHIGTKDKPLNLVSINGPRFSTRTESHLFRKWGLHVINMTTVPEAQLACEAEIAYAVLNHVTDYDCWHEEEDDVSASSVVEQLMRNVATGDTSLCCVLASVVRCSWKCGLGTTSVCLSLTQTINGKSYLPIVFVCIFRNTHSILDKQEN